MAINGAGQPSEPWPGCEDVDEGKEARQEGDQSRLSVVVLRLDEKSFLAGEGRIAHKHHVSVTLNWLRPGVLKLGEIYRIEVCNDRGVRCLYRALLRDVSVGRVVLQIVEEDLTSRCSLPAVAVQ
jgi:hypothetical protein